MFLIFFLWLVSSRRFISQNYLFLQTIMTGDPQIFYKQSERKFQSQQQLTAKILQGQLSTSSKYLPSIIIYYISQFLFHNPLKAKELLYSQTFSRQLSINRRYLLKQKFLGNDIGLDQGDKKQNRCPYRSGFITLTKLWKSINNFDLSYAEVMAKGKQFLHFFENMKIKVKPIKKLDPLQDYQAYKRSQKELKKCYDLIADNLQIVFQQFQEVFRYEKNKKINDIVIKSFKSLMNRNIAVIKIDENYYGNNPSGIQGKYVYIENDRKILLKPIMQQQIHQNNKQQIDIWLRHHKQDGWLINFNESELQFLDAVRFPLTRDNRKLFNQKLQQYLQQDVWITKL